MYRTYRACFFCLNKIAFISNQEKEAFSVSVDIDFLYTINKMIPGDFDKTTCGNHLGVLID